jgi:hypothetical protein
MVYKIVKVLGLGFAALAFWAVASAAQAATLTLTPSSQNLTIGNTVTVSIMLDTQGQAIDGVDIKYLNYNPYFLQVQDPGNQITAGSLMPNTLVNAVDTVNGKISFSQITNPGSHYTGSGVLATVTFKALVAGTANLTFDHAQAAASSDVASNGIDILSSVGSAAFSINYPAVTSGGTPPTGGGAGGGTGSGNGSGSGNPSPLTGGGGLRLINSNGTFYFIVNGVRHGITNPGMLYTYGFTFAMGQTASANDLGLPSGSLLTPNDGGLVKSPQDATVYLISNQQRYAFTSAAVYLALGFKWASVLLVTNPELQALPRAADLNNGSAGHLAGLDINRNGTVYWVGPDNQLHGYPSLAVFNSWHLPNDFTRVVPANAADNSLPVGSLVSQRVLQ